MNKKFKMGDKVRHRTDPSYTGTVTNVKYVPKKGYLTVTINGFI